MVEPRESLFVATALGRVKQAGLRVTQPRRAVLRALERHTDPLTAQDVFAEIERGGDSVDLVTVYRVLAAFEALGIVHLIGSAGGYVACRLDHQEGQQNHGVCEECGKTLEVKLPDEVQSLAAQSLLEQGFEPRAMRIEYLGRCQECALGG